MSEIRRKFDEEFKKNAVKLSYASPKTIGKVAKSLGVTGSMLYRWRKRYTADGDKTRFATLEEENRALRLEKSDGLLCQAPREPVHIRKSDEVIGGKWPSPATMRGVKVSSRKYC